MSTDEFNIYEYSFEHAKDFTSEESIFAGVLFTLLAKSDFLSPESRIKVLLHVVDVLIHLLESLREKGMI